jgi:Zn-dependent peptidase ImmA (M78 family)/transcriptional regulator with XRE-family HTH domain
MIGHRLRTARAAAGLSLRGLEAAIDHLVTAQAIGKYERDESMPSSAVLSALADALRVSEDYLLAPEELVLQGVDFRKKSKTPKKELAYIEGQALHLLERYLAVESTLRLDSEVWNKPAWAPCGIETIADAEKIAVKAREYWRLGIDPIPNLAELLEEHGIKVLSINLENIDGMTASVGRKSSEPLPVIVVKKSAWSERKRFTLAHELGHMLMRVPKKIDGEDAASRFAGAFLMPADALEREIGSHRSTISLGEMLDLKRRFGVSLQAIAHRCHDLRIIGDSAHRQLFREFSRRGWRKPPYKEPGALPSHVEEPKRMERLCFRALSEGLIGESRGAEILGLTVRELSRRMDAPGIE